MNWSLDIVTILVKHFNLLVVSCRRGQKMTAITHYSLEEQMKKLITFGLKLFSKISEELELGVREPELGTTKT